MRIRAPALAMLVLVLVCARSADAEADPRVDLTDCPGLDAREIARVLGIEIEALLARRHGMDLPPVQLTCHGSSVRVTVSDPVTGKTLARDVPAPGVDDPTRDRVIALAVSELFLSSWLELLLPPDTRVVPLPAAAPQVVVVTRVARRAIDPDPRRWEIGLQGAARWRDLGRPYVGIQPSLVAGFVFSDWLRLFVATGLEIDRAARQRGSVRSWASGLGIGAGLRAGGNGTLFWDAGVLVSAVSVQTSGQAQTDGTAESSASGLGGEAVLLAGPGLQVGCFFARLEAQGGVSFPGFAARVAGEERVQWGGPWVGAAIGLGLREPVP